MRYPADIARRADEILSERRQIAHSRLRNHQDDIRANHPDIWQAWQRTRIMGATLGMAYLSHDDDAISRHTADIQRSTAALAAMLEAAGYHATYLATEYHCPICEDKGMVGGRSCSCRIQILNGLVYEMLSTVGKVDECTFDRFDLSYYTGSNLKAMQRLLEACKRYVDGFNRDSPNLLFVGATGLGKTHLSLAIAQTLAARGQMVLYASAGRLIARLVDSAMGEVAEDEYRAIAYGCDLLIIDDLGTEVKTHVTKTEVHNLINTRLNEGRPTIISTNLTPKDIESTYDQRVASRILGCYVVNMFGGADIRFLRRQRNGKVQKNDKQERYNDTQGYAGGDGLLAGDGH